MQDTGAIAMAACLFMATGCNHSHDARPATTPLPGAGARPGLVQGICNLDPASCARVGGLRGGPRNSELDVAAGSQVAVAEAYSVQQVRRSASFLSGIAGGSSTAPPPGAQLPTAAAPAGPASMIEVEARFGIHSDNLPVAAERFRQLVRASGGVITLDTETLNANRSEATFEVRVPMAQYETITSGLDSIGSVRAREVQATDLAKQYHDEALLLANQEAAMRRYEDLLKTAQNVTDVMAIETQLDRLRAQIDRLKGDMAWMQDKVARATIRVGIYSTDTASDIAAEPVAAVYPGARFVVPIDVRSASQQFAYAGAGLSLAFPDAFGIHFGRALVLELDVAHSAFTTSAPGSSYAFAAMAGSDFYSDRLGGGRRTFLNPYLGWRMGFAETEDHGDFAFGGIVGLDIIKTKTVFVDLNARVLGLVGNDGGPHALIAPGVGANFAF